MKIETETGVKSDTPFCLQLPIEKTNSAMTPIANGHKGHPVNSGIMHHFLAHAAANYWKPFSKLSITGSRTKISKSKSTFELFQLE